MRILLIAGGWSTEREVSLTGAAGLKAALLRLGHEVTLFDPRASLEGLLQAAAAHDFAFINLHGRPGEDGLVQAMLERAGCPYQGSDPASSFLALHKAAAKEVFRFRGLPTPDWIFLARPPADDWRPNLPFPLFVKSNLGGSSLDLFRVEDESALKTALEKLFAQGQEVLIEPAVTGRDVTCAVLGNPGEERALPPVLIVPREGSYFDYENKYSADGAAELCPAPISPAATAVVQRLALDAHRALGLCGCSRADFILRDDDAPLLLEVNTLPGMTPASLLPKEAAATGLSFDELIETLIEMGLENHAG